MLLKKKWWFKFHYDEDDHYEDDNNDDDNIDANHNDDDLPLDNIPLMSLCTSQHNYRRHGFANDDQNKIWIEIKKFNVKWIKLNRKIENRIIFIKLYCGTGHRIARFIWTVGRDKFRPFVMQ